MTPTIILVPGLWVGPEPFTALSQHLSNLNIKTETAQLVSTGTTSPGNASMKDDIAAVRKHIQAVLDREEDVVLVLHSAGGFIGGGAANGLTKTQRSEGQAGVLHVVLLSGAVFPAGLAHKPLPFAVYENGACHCAEPSKLLFNDLSPESQTKWLATLQPQPQHGWDDVLPETPWPAVPSTYVICAKDNILPIHVQETCAATAGSKIQRLAAGHMPMLSKPAEVAGILGAVIASCGVESRGGKSAAGEISR